MKEGRLGVIYIIIMLKISERGNDRSAKSERPVSETQEVLGG